MIPDEAWEQALVLAWESFLAGTTPVGAVVVDAAGRVIAAGRGRRYEQAPADRQLAHCHIAHAEVNALALLPPTRHYEACALLTTLEPCCMCLGAAIQSTLTRLYYAGRDPYGGAAGLVIDTPQARRRPLKVIGPLEDGRGGFAELLHLRWLLDFPAADAILAECRRATPDLYELALRSGTADLFAELMDAGVTMHEALVATQELLPSAFRPA